MRSFVVVFAIVLAGCGCREYASPAVVAAKAANERSLATALSNAGLEKVAPQSEMPWAQPMTLPNVSQPTVVDSPKRMVVFPASREAPELVRDRAGKIHALVVKHDVVSSAGDRLCGCGPNASGGTAPPPPPVWYVALEQGQDWGPPVTVVTRWIEDTDTWPNAGAKMCSQIP